MTQSFLYTFVCFLQIIILKKRLLKFDQELSARWKKSYGLRNRLPTHWSYFPSKNLVIFLEALSVEQSCTWTGICSGRNISIFWEQEHEWNFFVAYRNRNSGRLFKKCYRTLALSVCFNFHILVKKVG